MTSMDTGKVAGALATCSAGVLLALVATASPAAANPADPVVPAPVIAVPGQPPAANVQASATDAAVLPPNGVPHLPSPDALPPGATMDRSVMGGDDPNVSYLKDLWHAVQNQEISGGEALLLGLSQRGMNTPYPEQAPGPTIPVTPGDPAPPAGPAPGQPLPPAP